MYLTYSFTAWIAVNDEYIELQNEVIMKDMKKMLLC